MMKITNSKSDSAGKDRVYVAEQLESRILYSAAPVEAPVEESPAENLSSENAEFESLENFFSSSETNSTDTFPESTDQSVILTSLNNLTSAELAILSEAATGRWVEAGISAGQLDALQQISYNIVDLEADILGSAEGYQIEIDINAAGKGWFIDTTPFQDEEFGIVLSATAVRTEEPAQFGVDLLSVLMHEQGHVLGLEDIYDSIGETSVMYGLFDEGERRIAADGEADESVAGSLEDVHYAVFDGAADGTTGQGVSGDLNTGTNYTGDTLPASTEGVYTEVVILDGDAVTALNSATTEVTIDVGSGTTFAAVGNALQFDGTGVSFTIGEGEIGEQTFTLANDSDIRVSNDIDQVQTINANIVLGTAGNNVINTGVAGSTLVINGKIDGGATGEPLLIFTGRGTAVLNGSIGSETTVEQISVYAGTIQTDAANLNNTRLLYFRLGHQAVTGTLELIGTEDVSVESQLTIGNNSSDAVNNGGSTILNNGSGVVTFSNTSFNDANDQNKSAKDLTLGGTNTGRNLIAGSIDNNNTYGGGLVNLIKQDEGIWVLGGDNGYTGTTTISEGRLDLNGTNLTNISVASGATLGGSGETSGSILFSDGSTIAADSTGAFSAAAVTVGDSENDRISVKLDSYEGDPITILNFDTATSNISAANFVLDPSVVLSERFSFAVFEESSPGVITLSIGYDTSTWTGTDSDAPTEWDNYEEDNWSNSHDTKYSDGDHVIFTDSDTDPNAPADDQTVILMEDAEPASITFSNNDITYEINDNGNGESITGSTALVKSGQADVTINTVNTYTGGTVLNQGILTINTDTALGTGTVTIEDQGDTPKLILGSNGLSIDNDFIITKINSVKQIIFDPDGTGNIAEITGDFTILETTTGAFEFYAGDGDTLILSGVLAGTGNPRIHGGTVIINNSDNSFENPLRVDSGVVEITSIADTGVNSAAGSGDKVVLGAVDHSGTLSYTGSGDSTDRQVQVGIALSGETTREFIGGGAIENNGANGGSGLIFTNPTLNTPDVASGTGVGERTLALGGSNTDANEIKGAILDNNGDNGANTVNLIKDGEGIWTLSGDNTYSGTTSVDAGELYINGSTAAGAVSIASGATLGGAGTINGAITSVGGTITGGTGNTPGTLTAAGGLTLDSDSTFEARFNSTSIYSQVIASGTVDLGGATLSLDFETTPPAGTEFVLIDGDTPITGTFSGFPDETSVTVDNHLYSVDYNGNDVVLNYIGEAIVPEQHFTTVDTAVIFGFDNFSGAGFAPNPVAGQLDSDQWLVTGMDYDDGSLGGTYTSDDFARGENDGGVTTGGVYAFDIDNDPEKTDPALGVQPGGSDFTPGGIVLKLTNNTGATLSRVDVAFDIAILNDQGRSNALSLQYATSTDGLIPEEGEFTDVADSMVISGETTDSSPAWEVTRKDLALTGLNLADGDSLFLLWTGDDVDGSGSRDEFALDNVVITPRVNAAPEITGGATATATFAENDSTTNIVYDVETTDDKDAEGSGLTYSFSTIYGGADNGQFNLDINTGEITFKTSPDFDIAGDANSDNDYEIEITVTDGGLSTDVQNITVSVTNENDNSPVITSEAAVEIAEGTTTVTTVVATDTDGDTVTYSLTGGADKDAFLIDETTGELTFNSTPDFETPVDDDTNNIYEVEITTADGTNTDVQTITITVINENDNSPVITSESTADVVEGTTTVTTVVATDADNDPVTYSLSGGADQEDFSIDENTGELTFNSTPDFDSPADADSNNIYEVEVTATDGSNTNLQTITVTVINSFKINTWTGTDLDAPTEWDNYEEDNWSNSYDSKYTDGDYIKFSDSLIEPDAPSSDQTIVLMEDVKPSSITFSNDNIAYVINDNGNGESISGSTTLTKKGTAEVTINSSNSYSGDTYLTQGILHISTDTALGSGTVLLYDNGVTPQLILDSNGMVIGNNFVIQDAGSTKQIRFDPDGTGNSAEFTGHFNLLESTSGSFEIYAGEGDTLIFSGLLSGTGNPRIRGGTIVLNNDDNSFDNPLRIDGGTVEITSIANGEVNSATGSGTKIFLGAINDDGVLSYIGSGDFTDRQIQIGISLSNESNEYTGGGVIENNGANGGSGLIFTNPTLNTPETASGSRVGERTLTLGGTNTDANEIQGAIIDNNGEGANTINLVKDGEGIWTLSGVNTYTGTTSVDEGELYINGSIAAGAVSVAAGATLGGTGTIIGAITSVGGTVTGGTGDTPGTLTAGGGLILDADSTFEAKLNSDTSYSQVVASGTVDLGGATLSLDFATPPMVGTEFILIDGDTPITGAFSGFPDETSVTIDGHNYTVNYDSNDVVLTYLGEAGAPEQHFTEVDSAVTFDFSEFAGTGFAADPVNGQLDSDQWVVTGMSDGDIALGETYTTGDFSRGENDGGTGTGGIYAFDIDNTSAVDPALGIQPGGSDFTPGRIILKITNQTGSTLTGADVAFDVAFLNDQDRSSSLTFQFATAAAADAGSVPEAGQFTDVANSTVTSDEAADGSNAWVITGKSLILTELNLADGDSFFLLWTGDDVDGSGSRDEFALDNVVITPRVNAAPEITGGATATATFAENDSTTNIVYDVETTDDKDAEGSGLTYSFSTIYGGADNGQFNLDINTGEITFKTSPDFDIAGDANSDNDYEIEITVTDGGLSTDVQNIRVSVTNENDISPVITSEAAVEVAEGTATVMTVVATDGDGDTVIYSLTGGADKDAFLIDENTGELTFNSIPDFGSPTDADTNNIYEVEVTATDGVNTDVQLVSVTITNEEVNMAPLVSADSYSVSSAEGSPTGNSGTFSDTAGDTVTITASTGTVIQNNTDGTWSWTYTPGDGPDDSRTVTITATDSENAVTTTSFELTVYNANPEADGGLSIITDEDNGGSVNLLTGATDPAGANDTLTIDISGYTNNGDGTFSKATDQGGSITVDPSTGEATYTPAFNFNGTDSFSFTVQDEDGGISTIETVSILVNPVNDAPVPNGDSNTASNSISKDIADGDEVGITADFGDVDGDTIAYSLIDDADGAFEIDPVTGVVTVADRTKLDFGSSSLYPIIVQGSDGNGGVQTQQYSIATVSSNELIPFVGIFDDNGLTGVVAAQSSETDNSLTLVTLLDQAHSDLELVLTNKSTGEKLFYSPVNIDRINGLQSITIGGSILQNLSQYSAVLRLGGTMILEFQDAEDLLDELSGNESTPGWLTSFYQFHNFDSSLV
ncbi:MAG: cadherin domain-containing protein [Verrucomicrobiales bacterium]|nr:cadherin domain-containing protein [Verrucomicrobiales bacterium]